MSPLLPCQQDALDRMASHARSRAKAAREGLEHLLEMSDTPHDDFLRAAATMKVHARVALHFHPDRPGHDHRPAVESLRESGLYRSQFETGLSNGNLSPFAGGERDEWEREYFSGAYHVPGVGLEHRPKYGALDLRLAPDGPAPRFGSCYFLLNPAVSSRCTFSYLDSHLDPRHRGTLDEMDDILFALVTHAFDHDFVLGERPVRPRALIDRLLALSGPRPDPATSTPSRNLNHYVEAQVHGSIELGTDVETLFADPSFRGTPIGTQLEALCRDHTIELRWVGGFTLRVDEVPGDFRGARMPTLARRIARDILDARTLGEAAVHLARDPEAWADHGDPARNLQDLKRLWHVLVRHGRWGASTR